METEKKPRFSVVIPVMNEEETVADLAAEVTAALEPLGLEWECVWVDDGSTDRTRDILGKIAAERPRHRLVELDRNYGQSAALAVGFREARGEIIGTLDGDGQNDPADFPRLLERLEEGDADVVNGIREKRRDSWIRRRCSRIANGFRNRLTREKVTDVGCAIRVFRRECTEHLPVFKGMHRFLPTLFRMQGYRITEMPVNHRPREKGQSKYGINNRLWVGIVDTLAVRWMLHRFVYPKIRRQAESVHE
jgi:dolichol-phosphate mannosyltransferase